ncbi:hypothetical protein [Cellulomonas sp.]|uniref:MarR family winged helix-turn-helix transcriptional regulator n=1 Tax=Cellulomonas sp. TaxID=40001 RepID=UPI001B11C672|nr:hypothetical protein [Cellulomonas sp.]MBO9553238.1 hypothetical protein [Cellulomonas sp.]
MRPVGYWLKVVDRLIESGFEEVLARDGLTRRHWQVLNVVHAGPADEAAVAQVLAAFEPSFEGPAGSGELTLLTSRRWLRREPEGYVFTEDGEEHFRVLEERVAAFRQAVVEGVSEQDYATAIGVLEQVARNLGWSVDAEGTGIEQHAL